MAWGLTGSEWGSEDTASWRWVTPTPSFYWQRALGSFKGFPYLRFLHTQSYLKALRVKEANEGWLQGGRAGFGGRVESEEGLGGCALRVSSPECGRGQWGPWGKVTPEPRRTAVTLCFGKHRPPQEKPCSRGLYTVPQYVIMRKKSLLYYLLGDHL